MIENGSEDVEEKERVDVCAVVVEMVKLEGELKKVIEVDDMIEEEEVELKAGEEGVKGKVEGEVEREGLGGEGGGEGGGKGGGEGGGEVVVCGEVGSTGTEEQQAVEQSAQRPLQWHAGAIQPHEGGGGECEGGGAGAGVGGRVGQQAEEQSPHRPLQLHAGATQPQG